MSSLETKAIDSKQMEEAAQRYAQLSAEEDMKEELFQLERKKHRDSFGFEKVQSLRTKKKAEDKKGRVKKTLVDEKQEATRKALENRSEILQNMRYCGNFELPASLVARSKMSIVPPKPPSVWERK